MRTALPVCQLQEFRRATGKKPEYAISPRVRISPRRAAAAVCGANARQSLLDRPQPCLLQMLVGTSRDAKPAVIGQIDDPARSVVVRGNVGGKNRFVTDQG